MASLFDCAIFPFKMYGEPWRKNVPFFQFLSTVHAKVANSNPINYIFLRSAINTLSIEHIKSPFFQILKLGWNAYYKVLYNCFICKEIKTHGSVLCGPRSRRVTPVSILTGRTNTQFSYLRSSVLPWWNKTIFAVDTPSNFSIPHSKFERNRFKRSRDMRLQKLT